MIELSTKGGKDFKKARVGLHEAVCFRLVDLGTQYNKTFDKYNRKIMFNFELVDEQEDEMRDGETELRNLQTSIWATASLGEKSNLRPLLAGWAGKDFDEDSVVISDFLGKPCNLSLVLSKDKEYINVSSLMPWNKKETPEIQNEIMEIGFDTKENFERFSKLSDNIKKQVIVTQEYMDASDKFGIYPCEAGGEADEKK